MKTVLCIPWFKFGFKANLDGEEGEVPEVKYKDVRYICVIDSTSYFCVCLLFIFAIKNIFYCLVFSGGFHESNSNVIDLEITIYSIWYGNFCWRVEYILLKYFADDFMIK